MKIRNLLVAAAAVAVFASSSAFAADFEVEKYDATNNAVSVADADITSLSTLFGDEMVVAIVPAGATAISESNLVYINQDNAANASTLLNNMLMKTLSASVTDYEVWVGGSNGTIKKGTFSTKTTPSFIYGDVNGDGNSDSADASEIMKYEAWLESVLDDGAEWRFLAGNVTIERDGDDLVDSADASEIMKYEAWLDSTLDSLL